MTESHASGTFWSFYKKLPGAIQRAADRQFVRFRQDPGHPSLHFKQVGEFWSVRVTGDFRALAYERLIG